MDKFESIGHITVDEDTAFRFNSIARAMRISILSYSFVVLSRCLLLMCPKTHERATAAGLECRREG